MKKLGFLMMGLLLFVLSACGTSEQATSRAFTSPPGFPEIPEGITAQSWGYVPCYAGGREYWCLSLQIWDGYYHNSHEGAWVAELQKFLKHNDLGVTVDGYFGPKTNQAVGMAQVKYGLVLDGVVGTCTWSALLNRGNALNKCVKR